ncbi:MAG: class I SAM-dependent methyltransferase [Saprospiraceae bacterium]
MHILCPLCHGYETRSYADGKYSLCYNCKGLFIPSDALPDVKTEYSRYLKHHSTVDDDGYLQFIKPIIEYITNLITIEHRCLDFGSGQYSTISQILRKKGYSVEQYDPFFYNHPQLLQEKYDFIVACEVIEHFHHPFESFESLHSCLQDKGEIIGMTHIYDGNEEQFKRWYYRRDITHTFIYQRDTFEWITNQWNYSKLHIDGRLFVLTK